MSTTASPTLPSYLKLGEIARMLRVSTKSLRDWIEQGQFPRPVRIGGTQRWRADVVEEFLAQAAKGE